MYTALTQSCPAGYYFASSSSNVCTKCEVGYYCADGLSRVVSTATYPTLKTGATSVGVGCPAGFTCSTIDATANSNGYYSLAGSTTATQQAYVSAADLPSVVSGGQCPTNFYTNSAGLSCTPNSL